MSDHQVAPPAAPRLFRIECEWEGGGFGRTLPFVDEAEARAWAQGEINGRPGASISVVPREPVQPAKHDEAAAIEADLAYNRMKNSGELFRQEVRQAERLERFNPQQDAWR